MDRRLLILVLGLAGAAAVLLAFLLEGDPSGSPNERGAEVQQVEEGVPELLGPSPALQGRGETGPGSEAAGAGATSGDAAQGPTHVLVGTVGGLAPGEAAATGATVRALRSYGWVDEAVPPLLGGLHADGSYEIDVSRLFARPEPPSQIRVTFDHASHAPAQHKVAVRDGRPRSRDGALEMRLDLTLEPALVVEGRVVSEVGDPLPEVEVALFERLGHAFRLDAIDEVVALEAVTTKADGRFRLRSARAGLFLVAAFSRVHQPGRREVMLRTGVPADEVELRMMPGLRIAGRVTVNGRPLAKVRVEAERVGDDAELQWNFHRFVWREGRILPGELHAQSDADGRYVITGLDAGTRRVVLGWIPDLHVWRALMTGLAREIEPPADGLDLAIEAAEVEIRVVSGAEPVGDVFVTIKDPQEEQGSYRTSQGPVVRAVLPADRTFHAEVKGERFQTRVDEFRTQSPGKQQLELIDLGPPAQRAALVVKLRTAADEPVPRACLVLKPVEEKTYFGFSMAKVLQSTDGTFRLQSVEAGRKALFVLPDRSDMEFVGHYLTLREEVQLQLGRETELRLVARRGGRLRVAARDEAGNLLGAQATLQDAHGRALEVAYVSGGDNFASMSTGGPGTGSVSTVEPPLEPGVYRIELSFPGRETKTLDVEVEAGKTTDVDVTLRRL